MQVDCQAHQEVCDGAEWAVSSVPTLKAYRDGEIFPYLDRPVTAMGIVEFMKSLAGIDDSYDDDDDDDEGDDNEALEGQGGGDGDDEGSEEALDKEAGSVAL